jgi:hypothetical protein
MSTARIHMRGSALSAAARMTWVRAGAALFGAAWGSNQFTPMLLVYRRQLGLSTARSRPCSVSTPSDSSPAC